MNIVGYYLTATARYKKEGYKKQDVMKKLESFFGTPYHLHFARNLKIGINPKYGYKDHIGIYTYTLDKRSFNYDMPKKISTNSKVSYRMLNRKYKNVRSKMSWLETVAGYIPPYTKYIFILKPKGLTTIQNYGKKEYDKDIQKLYSFIDLPKETIDKCIPSSTSEYIYKLEQLTSRLAGIIVNNSKKTTLKEVIPKDRFEDISPEEDKDPRFSVALTKICRKLGHKGFSFGQQAVTFSPRNLRVVYTVSIENFLGVQLGKYKKWRPAANKAVDKLQRKADSFFFKERQKK
jgi:hypothetical protein